MIDAVVFDIGNVLLKFDYFVAARRLMARNGLAEPPDRARIVAAKEALEGGRIDRGEFLRLVKPEFHHTDSDESFLEMWEDIFEENLPMTSLAAELSGRAVPTFLLSNVSCIHHEFVFRKYPVFSTFRDGVFSYKVGVLKPESAIFEHAIHQFRIDPNRTAYVDDLAENVAAASRLGFRGVVYDWRHHEDAVAQLCRLGLRVSSACG